MFPAVNWVFSLLEHTKFNLIFGKNLGNFFVLLYILVKIWKTFLFFYIYFTKYIQTLWSFAIAKRCRLAADRPEWQKSDNSGCSGIKNLSMVTEEDDSLGTTFVVVVGIAHPTLQRIAGWWSTVICVLGRAKHLETKSWYLSINFRPNTSPLQMDSIYLKSAVY
jgi:hypothetical protein